MMTTKPNAFRNVGAWKFADHSVGRETKTQWKLCGTVNLRDASVFRRDFFCEEFSFGENLLISFYYFDWKGKTPFEFEKIGRSGGKCKRLLQRGFAWKWSKLRRKTLSNEEKSCVKIRENQKIAERYVSMVHSTVRRSVILCKTKCRIFTRKSENSRKFSILEGFSLKNPRKILSFHIVDVTSQWFQTNDDDRQATSLAKQITANGDQVFFFLENNILFLDSIKCRKDQYSFFSRCFALAG